MSKNVTPKQSRAIESLITDGDKVTAAAAAGVSRQTLYRWLHDPTFTNELNAATCEAIEALSRKLAALGEQAATTLESAMKGADTPASVRVRAADITLARLLQLRELSVLEQRVTELEKKITKGGNHVQKTRNAN